MTVENVVNNTAQNTLDNLLSYPERIITEQTLSVRGEMAKHRVA